MPVDRTALEGAKKALRIFDVYFRDEEVALPEDLIPQFEFPESNRVQFKMQTRLLHDFELPQGEKQRHLVEIEFKGSVRCVTGDEEEGSLRVLVSIELSLGLLYDMKSECSPESLQEFVRANAPYHAIPYWREHVHCVCAKRRIPIITVPLYTKLPPLADGTAALEIK